MWLDERWRRILSNIVLASLRKFGAEGLPQSKGSIDTISASSFEVLLLSSWACHFSKSDTSIATFRLAPRAGCFPMSQHTSCWM